MTKPRVVLVDPDENYIAPLELRFLEEFGDGINLEVITDEHYLSEFLSAPHDIEALLVAEAWYGSGFGGQNIVHLFILTEDEQYDKTRDLGVEYTFKYSSLNLIFNKVTSVCTQLQFQAESTARPKIILFYSPVGGSGSTTLALAVAAALQNRFKRTLYVDAEHLQTFGYYLEGGKTAPNGMARDMMRLSGNAYEAVRDCIEHNGFDYLPPLRANLAALGVEFDFFTRFVTAARDSGNYDYVIVDTDSVFNDEKPPLFTAADVVAVSVLQERSAMFKVQKFKENIDGVALSKCKFICNQYRKTQDSINSGMGDISIDFDCYVEYVEGASSASIADVAQNEGCASLAKIFE